MRCFTLFVVTGIVVFSLCSCGVQRPKGNYNSDVLSLYVSKDGSDEGDGSKSKPFFSIHKALQKAYEVVLKTNAVVEINIGEGVYSVGDGLDPVGTIYVTNRVSIRGGFDSEFSEVKGVSVIDLTNTGKQGIVIQDVNSIEVSGIVVVNAKAFSVVGGGILIKNVSNLVISNVIISNSTSLHGGGGVALDGVTDSKLFLRLVGNTSFGTGGGMFVYGSHRNEIYALALHNYSTSYGGGIHVTNSASNVFRIECISNFSAYGGGISVVGSRSRDNDISGNVSYNSSSGGGGGIYMSRIGQNFISGVIQGNSSPLGGGVFIEIPQGQIIISESILTNTWSSGVKKSVVYITNQTSSTPLILDKCQIGGAPSTSPYGIYEDGVDISGHSVTRNLFFTNWLSKLYRDPDGEIDVTEVSMLNTFSSLHDAISLGGNAVSNQ